MTKNIALTSEEIEALARAHRIAYRRIDSATMEFVKIAKEHMPNEIEDFEEGLKPAKEDLNKVADLLRRLGVTEEIKTFYLTKEDKEEAMKDRIEKITGIRPEIGNEKDLEEM